MGRQMLNRRPLKGDISKVSSKVLNIMIKRFAKMKPDLLNDDDYDLDNPYSVASLVREEIESILECHPSKAKILTTSTMDMHSFKQVMKLVNRREWGKCHQRGNLRDDAGSPGGIYSSRKEFNSSDMRERSRSTRMSTSQPQVFSSEPQRNTKNFSERSSIYSEKENFRPQSIEQPTSRQTQSSHVPSFLNHPVMSSTLEEKSSHLVATRESTSELSRSPVLSRKLKPLASTKKPDCEGKQLVKSPVLRQSRSPVLGFSRYNLSNVTLRQKRRFFQLTDNSEVLEPTTLFGSAVESPQNDSGTVSLPAWLLEQTSSSLRSHASPVVYPGPREKKRLLRTLKTSTPKKNVPSILESLRKLPHIEREERISTLSLPISPLKQRNVQVLSPARTTRPYELGLKNFGNTCYISATLQALFSLTAFTRALTGALERHCPSPVHRHLLELVQFRQTGSVDKMQQALKDFCSSLACIHPSYGNAEQQDAHELCSRLLDFLGATGVQYGEAVGQFEFWLQETGFCSRCGKKSVRENKTSLLPLYLTQAKSTLTEAMASYFSAETRPIQCGFCASSVTSISLRMASLPKILTFLVNRESHLNVPSREEIFVNDPLEFNSPYLADFLADSCHQRYQYQLRAAIHHVGSSHTSGHYVSHCLCPDGVWRSYDDSVVAQCNPVELLQEKWASKSFMYFFVGKNLC